jgi:hypothetical protein
MDPRGVQVVSLDRNGRQKILDEGSPRALSSPIGEFDADQELSGCDSRYRDVIVIAHNVFDCRGRSFSGNQNGRVEDQPFQ